MSNESKVKKESKKSDAKQSVSATQKWDMMVDALSLSAHTTIVTLLDRLAIFSSAAVPAMSLGYSLSAMLITAVGWNPVFAGLAGFAAAFGLEGYGLKALRARHANGDNDELRKKTHIYLFVTITLLWADAAVLLIDSIIGGIAVAITGTGFAVLSFNYYAINGIESAIEKNEETAVSEQERLREREEKEGEERKAEAVRLRRRQEQIEDDERKFKADQKALENALKRKIKAHDAANKGQVARPQAVRKPSADLETDISDAPPQSSGSSLSSVRKEQLSVIYGQLVDGEAVTADGIADMLGVTPRTARRIIADGTRERVLVSHGEKTGAHMKNGRHPSTL